MKKYIKSSDMKNGLRNWLASDEVEKLMKGMSRSEKRIVGKIANVGGDAESYVFGICDAIDMYEIRMSDAFESFMSHVIEEM